jgi:hypothetical protein
MKCIVALTVIASVAASNLRATKDDKKGPAKRAFSEMTNHHHRALQMLGVETTMVGETSVMIEQKSAASTSQDKSQMFNQFRKKPTVTGGDIPDTETYMKDESEVEEEDTEDFDARIVGGEVSDSNEFPYYGTSNPFLSV